MGDTESDVFISVTIIGPKETLCQSLSLQTTDVASFDGTFVRRPSLSGKQTQRQGHGPWPTVKDRGLIRYG